MLLQSVAGYIGITGPIEINAFVAGMVALSVVFSSYASEVLLSAFKAIPKGQYEAGDALGLSRSRTMVLIIIPQLVRIALPGMTNLWVILLKDTSYVSIIGLADIIRQTGIAARVSKGSLLFLRHRLPALPHSGAPLIHRHRFHRSLVARRRL